MCDIHMSVTHMEVLMAPMTKHNKIQITVQLDPDQVATVDEVAQERHTSRASVVRHAVDFFVANHMQIAHMRPRTNEPVEERVA